MATIISNDPRGNPAATVNRFTGTPDKFMFTIDSKPQQKPAKAQWSKILLFNKYRLQVRLRIRKNSKSASTSHPPEERYKNQTEARVFQIFYTKEPTTSSTNFKINLT
jgi:hypothetical protein